MLMSLNENESAHKRLVDMSIGRKCMEENVPKTILFPQAMRCMHDIFCWWHYFWITFYVLRQGFMEFRLVLNSLYV